MPKLLLFPLFFLMLGLAWGQSTLALQDEERLFATGLELYAKEKYGASRRVFETYKPLSTNELKKAEASYYMANCALRLFHADGELLLENFVRDYPRHAYTSLAYFELGNFHYQAKRYDKASQAYQQVDMSQLDDTRRDEAQFKLGYALFAQQRFDEALAQLEEVKRGKASHQHAAAYYSGYIHFINKDYIKAEKDLLMAQQNESYAGLVPPVLSNVYYRQQAYDQVISYGETALASEKPLGDEASVRLLVAESYFLKSQFAKAQTHYEAYQQKQTPSNEVLYRIGFTQFRNGDQIKALENFKQVALKDDTVSQYAAYYLGLIYLEQNNKIYAASAFDMASQATYNPELQREALFAFGKINFELGHYHEAIISFKRYKELFGQNSQMDEVDNYLGEAYLKSDDLNEAIRHLEAVGLRSPKLRETFQRVTFYKATEYFNSAQYFNAVQLFEQSLNHPINKQLAAQAHFWTGEAYAIGYKHGQALNEYAQVFTLLGAGELYHTKARYGAGYAYFNTKDYIKALPHFKAYVEQTQDRTEGGMYYLDALLRLADCYYATKQYRQALTQYEASIKTQMPDKDYPWFQKGLVHFALGENELAKNAFATVVNAYRRSRFRDNALFQWAQVDFEQGQYEAAIDGFTRLIDTEKQSGLLPNAYLNRAISFFNLKRYEQATTDYQTLLREYPTSSVGHAALLGLQETLALQSRAEEFDTFLVAYKRANPESGNLEVVEFESAKTLHFNQKYTRAIIALQDFVAKYPQSSSVGEAKFYIGESHYRLGQVADALEAFYALLASGHDARLNRALQRVAELEYKQGNYAAAIAYNEKLLDVAKTKKEQFNAWSGMMQSYFMQGQYDSTAALAELILERGNVNVDAQNMAYLYLGKAAFERGHYDDATDHFLTALNTAKDENGAEAQYLMAKILFLQKKHKQSVQSLFNLNQNFAIYERWLGESFLLIADNYLAMQEYFQAKATLNSVIEKSPFADIKEQARVKLAEVNSFEKNVQGSTNKDTTIK
ncbi:MAG: tetratricopeptide repeat protein [Cytophagales bacterium]|nr:tetratricopeptide repeat protein [Cytophagales bacterium]